MMEQEAFKKVLYELDRLGRGIATIINVFQALLGDENQ